MTEEFPPVTPFSDPPEWRFVHGPDDAPLARRDLVQAVGCWFREQCARPELFAAMLVTFDDGPFVGDEVSTADDLTCGASADLGATRRLMVRAAPGAQPDVLRCLEGERVLWTRRITGGSAGAVSRIELLDPAVADFGSLGRRVNLVVEWSYGREYSHLCLGRDCRFLFYFLSW